jgi:hypothetical protein
MPAIVPLSNIKLQSPLDLSNKGVSSANLAKRFIFKDPGATSKVIDASDVGKLLEFPGACTISLSNNISDIVAGDTFRVTAPASMGDTGPATRHVTFSDATANSVKQYVYIGANNWIVINSN